jgi:hypothetical protein
MTSFALQQGVLVFSKWLSRIMGYAKFKIIYSKIRPIYTPLEYIKIHSMCLKKSTETEKSTVADNKILQLQIHWPFCQKFIALPKQEQSFSFSKKYIFKIILISVLY